ncbi:alkane 1-monooxygenase [Acinetobacter haemolyticus]|uniref:alkane 1-monooxygenase n=1 Tax=Acinetobacter haemolyticus TaxID=29430 RepID=UPI001331F0DC|nr:alkane 1-monooxygenase [Acinetobacter haemolyticus]NAR19221.1 alkane 1-monooxygenase [Acinetobacter haemolyticus]NAR37306.1 alkane 1-monooxygenase [Acinetobacter haemolyticus]NAR47008.1 alkane 1-monooxygenase [Acinetobacter haemolyticus]NCU22486.1 alkane 1-monooxygenase [Acinetobacter haemolyticus]QHI20113.1 alkane 1-monooxygenase [Acinetobacter haemolyticus]
MNMHAQLDVEQTTTPFKDKKRHLWLLGLAVPAIAMSGLAGYQFGPKKSKKFFASFGPLFIHGVIPTLDKLIGEDTENPPLDAIADLEADPYYSRIVKLFIPLQYATNVYGAYLASRKGTSVADQVLLGTLVGMVNGIAINTAHELSHKNGRLEHYLSHLALAPSGYNHFRIEHPYGHHRRVATPEDPASSRLGETFWKFLPRTVIGSFKSAIEIEKKRLERKKLPFFCKENELIHGWAMSAIYHGLMFKKFGIRSVPFQLTQATYAVTLFEAVNYIEHYGLKREKKENGQYERTLPEHSWNNNNLVTNLFLYQLQRHSDHHAYPTRSFQTLRHFENAPQLPAGYGAMLLPAFIPTWWSKIMDDRVVEHYNGDLSKVNLHPDAEARIYEKYAEEIDMI